MLTIREALSLPVFAACRVVAGEGGLENQIRWVHIVDIPDTTYAWHRRGVLLLTAGYGLRDNPENQKNLIPILVKQGFAGMVLSTGYYFDHTPQVILDSADASNFPVIEAPPDLLFIEITETVLERIISRQYTLLQQSTDIFTQLTNLVLEGVNLEGLAKVLAELTERSVTIEDPTFRVLATTQHGRVDEARRQSVDNGQTPSDLAQHLLNAGIYDALLEKMEPLHVAPMPDFGMDMERVIMPIVVDREIHGYIWLIAGDDPLTPLDEMAIRHGATVAALILFKEITNWFRKQRRFPLVAWRDHYLVLILENDSSEDGKRLADELVESLNHPTLRLLVGLGRAYETAAIPNAIRQSYEEAEEAIRISQAMGVEEGVVAFHSLGLLHWLYHLPPEKQADNLYLGYIRILYDYDQERDAELVKTLECYLEHGGALVETAKILFIHRNTLLHRLERIESLCHIDLRDPLHRLNLYAAVKSYRLRGGINNEL